MALQGTVLLDFGAFPGQSDASVLVAQPTITAGSLVEAWIFPADTADHTADEHMLETLKVFAGNVQAGVGFTVYGFNTCEINEPNLQTPTRFTGVGSAPGRGKPDLRSDTGGKGTRLYGKFNIGWVFN
jgi:hypothetical protein